MELNNYDLDKLNVLALLVSLGKIAYLQDNGTNAPTKLIEDWEKEITQAIKDATFEYGKLPY